VDALDRPRRPRGVLVLSTCAAPAGPLPAPHLISPVELRTQLERLEMRAVEVGTRSGEGTYEDGTRAVRAVPVGAGA
jgi:hypothetical protein